jgi:deoxycytidine triphosphate deaminase
MYLTDREIRARLPQLDVRPDLGPAFDPDRQIQPCSVDLRLSSTYWRPRKKLKGPVDLSRVKLLEAYPRRHWTKHTLGSGESITLRPGAMVLGRVLERITIPNDCAGSLEGRSSFARMGLSVHCTGGFINPGWTGHMPLTLYNCSPITLRIPGHIPICQLMLVKLGALPARVYGSQGLESKYLMDDGGPSYWWRDRAIRDLIAVVGRPDVAPDIQARLLDRIGTQPVEILERLNVLVSTRASTHFANVDELLDEFEASEDRQRARDRGAKVVGTGLFPVLVGVSSAYAFVPLSAFSFVVWALNLVAAPISWRYATTSLGAYLGHRERAALPPAPAPPGGPPPGPGTGTS